MGSVSRFGSTRSGGTSRSRSRATGSGSTTSRANDLAAADLESKKEIGQLQEQLVAVCAENADLQKKNSAMEEKIEGFREKDRQREERDTKAAADFESLNHLLKDNLAENKVLRETIRDERQIKMAEKGVL